MNEHRNSDSSFPLGAAVAVAVFAAMIYLAHWRVQQANRRIAAMEIRMALVETNSGKSQADLGKLAEAVLLWRMSLPIPTNQVIVMTNIPTRALNPKSE